jgi:hypothetical protein
MIALVILILGLPVLAYWAATRFLDGSRTTELLKELINEYLGGEVTVMPLQWSGLAAYSDGLEVRNAHKMDQLRVDQFRGEVSLRGLLIDRVWKLCGIEAQKLELHLGGTTKTSKKPPYEPERIISKIPWWAWWLPTEVEWGTIKIAQAHVTWPWEIHQPDQRAEVKEMRVLLTQERGGWNIHGNQGELKLPNLPNLRLVNLSARLREPYFFITTLQWQSAEGRGEGEVSGELALEENLSSRLILSARSVPLETFIKGDWRARFLGNLEGSIELHSKASEALSKAPWKGTGKAKIVDGVIDALPQLEAWAQFSGLNEYRRLRLHRAEADCMIDEKGLTLYNVKLESINLVRLEGRVTIDQNNLDGLFELGLTENQVRKIPGGSEKIFTRKAEGYLWAVPPVRIYGTVDQINEDLSARVGSAFIDKMQRTIENNAEKILERLRSWF